MVSETFKFYTPTPSPIPIPTKIYVGLSYAQKNHCLPIYDGSTGRQSVIFGRAYDNTTANSRWLLWRRFSFPMIPGHNQNNGLSSTFPIWQKKEMASLYRNRFPRLSEPGMSFTR